MSLGAFIAADHLAGSTSTTLNATLTSPGGRWAEVEVTSGSSQIEKGARSLARTMQQIDTSVVGKPVLKAVTTDTGPMETLPNALNPDTERPGPPRTAQPRINFALNFTTYFTHC
ncbi:MULTISPECIES: hypothetical protein [unclassified Actinomyces]|uniref:hypothetical protein n=1 Tax=unclassified Actinomyces TaxID=2609248 RepID=UPI0013A70B40|nr:MULTISPECIES: hypothetical protein [unclassified Actinomyces]MBW3069780.1 hypothetical protein [Actinomyces sp. 594]NDR54110.1 hypothetical protein [Actinomyces sp. 565]